LRAFISVLFTLFAPQLLAAGWAAIEVEDPILEGKICTVHEPTGWGSYIYHSPSKYDQIFWPFSEVFGIWYCTDSGFIALTNDFGPLSAKEIERIREFLEASPLENNDTKSKLKRLDEIYSLRDKDIYFKNKLMRVLAWLYQSESEFEIANEYRMMSLEDIKLSLDRDLPELQKLEYLYLAVNYSKQFGNENDAKDYERQSIISIDSVNDDDDEAKGLAQYLGNLISESVKIIPGGILEPVNTQ